MVDSNLNGLETRSQDFNEIYVNVDIHPAAQNQVPKEKGRLLGLFRSPSQLETIDGTALNAETDVKARGVELPKLDSRTSPKAEVVNLEPELGLPPSHSSKTRLLNLPPKDPEEERKHLAQFQAMMVAAKQRDAAKAAKVERARMVKEDVQHHLTLQWSTDILPNWGNPGVAARAERLAFLGIPSSCRGQVWSRSLKGEAKSSRPSTITSETYAFLLERANHPPPSYLAMTQRNAQHIVHDAAGVFPELGLFGGDSGSRGEPGPYYTPLLNVLKAHASLAPTEVYENRAVGSLAGMLLLHMDEAEAFMALQVLLCRPMHAAFASSTQLVTSYLKAFDLAFSERLSRLYTHFQRAQLRSEMFLNSWLVTLFTKHLDFDVCCYVWDCYIVMGERGEEILLEVALVMLGWLEPHLYGRLDEALDYLGQPVCLTLDYLVARFPGCSPKPSSLAAVVSGPQSPPTRSPSRLWTC